MQIQLSGLPRGTIIEIGDGLTAHTFVMEMEHKGVVRAHRKGVRLYELPPSITLRKRFTWLYKYQDKNKQEHVETHDIMRPTSVRIELPHEPYF